MSTNKRMQKLWDLKDVIQGLKDSERMGAEKDEPEGSRYVQISETALKQIIEILESTDQELESLTDDVRGLREE